MRPTHTPRLPRPIELDLHESDILAQLPSLSDWAIAIQATPSRLSREVLNELPSLAGLQGQR